MGQGQSAAAAACLQQPPAPAHPSVCSSGHSRPRPQRPAGLHAGAGAVLGLGAWRGWCVRQRRRRVALRARGGEESGYWTGLQLTRADLGQLLQLQLSEEQKRAKQAILEAWQQDESEPVVLQGLTGTGKTRVMAAVAQAVQRPTLLLSHNKELARQLSTELLTAGLDAKLLVSAFEDFVPQRIDAHGRLHRGVARVDREILETRLDALRSIAGDAQPVVVSSISAVYPVLDDSQLARLNVDVARIRADTERHAETLIGRGKRAAAQRLRVMVAKDLDNLRVGSKQELRRYAAYLPEGTVASPAEIFARRFGSDWVLMVDECHAMLPTLSTPRTAALGRQQDFVEHGFALPSSLESLPQRPEELLASVGKTLFVSATPREDHFEKLGLRRKLRTVRMVHRPTHILDPLMEYEPMTKGFFLRMFKRLQKNRKEGRQALVACSTTAQADLLALRGFRQFGLRTDVVHSGTLPQARSAVVSSFRRGEVDVLFGVALIREGMDFPGVSLVYIIDADSGNGLSRSVRPLLQLAGRAARHPNGHVVLAYRRAPNCHMEECKTVSQRQRGEQQAFNAARGLEARSLPRPELGAGGEARLSPRLRRVEAEMLGLREVLQVEVLGLGAERAAAVARNCSCAELLKNPRRALGRVLEVGLGQGILAMAEKYLSSREGQRRLQALLEDAESLCGGGA